MRNAKIVSCMIRIDKKLYKANKGFAHSLIRRINNDDCLIYLLNELGFGTTHVKYDSCLKCDKTKIPNYIEIHLSYNGNLFVADIFFKEIAEYVLDGCYIEWIDDDYSFFKWEFKDGKMTERSASVVWN